MAHVLLSLLGLGTQVHLPGLNHHLVQAWGSTVILTWLTTEALVRVDAEGAEIGGLPQALVSTDEHSEQLPLVL